MILSDDEINDGLNYHGHWLAPNKEILIESHLEANAKIKELVKRTLSVYKAEKRLMEIMDEVDRILRDLAASADSLYTAAELKDVLGKEKEEA